MRVLLLGAHGQLGKAMSAVLPGDTLRWGRRELDFAQPALIGQRIRSVKPEVIINTAALTEVDACESDRSHAQTVNAEAPRMLALVSKELDALLVHISTDYVFGGEGQRHSPYVESDAPAPVNCYGMTKWEGERFIQETGGDYLIARVCGLYGGQRARPNYIDRVIEQARRGESVRIKFDQVYSPTSVRELAPALWRLIGEQQRGILHVANTQPVSRYEFTKAILEILGAKVSIDVTAAPYEGVPRPRYSALESERIVLGNYMSDWRTALQAYLRRRV